jgi:hypothetical protein
MSVFSSSAGVARENARHVHGDVAARHHRHPLLREIELAIAIVGMPVVPGHELGGRMAAGRSSPGIPMRRSVWAPVV